MTGYLDAVHAEPGMAGAAQDADHEGMDGEQTLTTGDRPHWLGSPARQRAAEGVADMASVEEPTWTDGLEEVRPRWLGSLARTRAATGEAEAGPAEEAPPDGAGWQGSDTRRTLYATPSVEPEPAPAAPTTPVADAVDAFPDQGRIVVGELGMALRAA